MIILYSYAIVSFHPSTPWRCAMEPHAQQPSVPGQAHNGPQPPACRDKPAAGRRAQYQRREARRAERNSRSLPWTDIPASRSRGGSNCRTAPSRLGCALRTGLGGKSRRQPRRRRRRPRGKAAANVSWHAHNERFAISSAAQLSLILLGAAMTVKRDRHPVSPVFVPCVYGAIPVPRGSGTPHARQNNAENRYHTLEIGKCGNKTIP